MTLTDWLAIYGAVASTLAGAWVLYEWWTRGPKLHLTASPNMIIIGDPAREGRTFISINVTNRGSEPTTITNVGLVGFDNAFQKWRRRASFNAVINHALPSYNLPGVLAVGGDWRSLCEQTENLENIGREKRLYVWVSHTFSDRLPLARVIITRGIAST